MMHLKVLTTCLLIIFIRSQEAVKIGVARMPANATTTTATTLAPITEASIIVTEISTQDITEAVATTTTTTTTSTTTTQRNLPTFPPKKVQTSIKRATAKPTTTTTTTTSTTVAPTLSANNISADQLHNATLTAVIGDDDQTLYYYCSCDLHAAFCDINCCCDLDCTEAMRKVFICHTNRQEKTQQQRLEDFQYTHGLPSCKVNDGWLCVFRTNIKPPQEQCPVQNYDTTAYYKWPQTISIENAEEEHENRHYYIFGEPLRLLNVETMTGQTFELPTSFKPPYCQVMTPIRHLIPHTSNCLVETPEQLQESVYNLLNFTNNAKLLKAPSYGNYDLSEDAQNLATIRICRKSLTIEELQCFDTNSGNITENMDMSYEYATDIVLKVIHNYTNIQELIVVFHMSALAEDISELWQRFSVEFAYQNLSTLAELAVRHELKDKPISGPLGYLPGAPVIISQLMTTQNDETINRLLDYFHPNASATAAHHTLPLFSKRLGVCHKQQQPDITYAINYGVNVAKECNLQFSSDELHKSNRLTVNYTAYCQRLQDAIMLQLLPGELKHVEQMSLLFISKLGKPSPVLDKWLTLELKNYDYVPISGDFNEQTQTYTCRNVILGAGYEFHIGVYTVNNMPHQRLIKRAAYVAGQRHDLEFEITEVVELPLTMSVMFYDLRSGRSSGGNGIRLHYQSVAYIFHAALILVLCNTY